jgi:CAAX prenyl protease-related protein
VFRLERVFSYFPRVDSSRRQLLAYTLPFFAFLGFLALDGLIASMFETSGIWMLAVPKYWLFPVQTVVCAGILLYFWKDYTFGPLRPWLWGVGAGILALGIWVSPQELFHVAPRTKGFDPEIFQDSPLLYNLTVAARFARLVIVVPLLEEIFWRGFLLRYLINERFTSVNFGTYRPFSFFGVAALFMLVHAPEDYIGAFLTGLLYNGVAVKTKSLWACVLAHAVTNLGLGLYIMATRQWGFW